jgi:hypothetical protein
MQWRREHFEDAEFVFVRPKGFVVPVVRNSIRAFAAVLVLVAAFHGVMAVLGLGAFLAAKLEPPTPDQAFLTFLMRVAVDALALATGHYLMRTQGWGTRMLYGLMGGGAMALSYAFSLWGSLNIMPPLDGTRLSASALPILVGMVAGTLYAQLAGRETVPGRAEGTAETREPAASTSPVTFDGPVQVRTSLAATAIASVVPAAIVALMIAPFAALFLTKWDTSAFQNPVWANQISRMILPAYFFMLTLFATAIPAAIVVGVTHTVARLARRTRGMDYAMLGAAVMTVACLAFLIYVPLMYFSPLVIAGALMGAVYRRFAGLEPLALPEAVLATDPATLVAKDDPARRTRAVILNG